MTATPDRLELRITTRDKQVVARAAELKGEGLSTFARGVLLREAQRIVEAEQSVTLSASQTKRFLKALDRPFAPNAALRKAMARGDKLGL
ncbi:MAG: DUF1778 domain-containing protein [Lysobacter sp.]|nr:DUF1778 domain-containing protein [Lysobacter sp.]